MSNLYSFQFLNQRPEDLNPMMQVTSRDIGYPKRNVITATVPFSSQEFDFSEAGGDASWSVEINGRMEQVSDTTWNKLQAMLKHGNELDQQHGY